MNGLVVVFPQKAPDPLSAASRSAHFSPGRFSVIPVMPHRVEKELLHFLTDFPDCPFVSLPSLGVTQTSDYKGVLLRSNFFVMVAGLSFEGFAFLPVGIHDA